MEIIISTHKIGGTSYKAEITQHIGNIEKPFGYTVTHNNMMMAVGCNFEKAEYARAAAFKECGVMG